MLPLHAVADPAKWTDVVSAVASGWSGLLALAAGVVAYFALRASRATNAAQAEQLRLLEQAQRSEHAGQFGVWLDKTGDHGTPFGLCYHNASNLPIYAVQVRVEFSGVFFPQVIELGDIPPTTVPRKHEFATVEVFRLVGVDDFPLDEEHIRRFRLMCDLEVSFIDSSGQRWCRPPGGGLTLRN